MVGVSGIHLAADKNISGVNSGAPGPLTSSALSRRRFSTGPLRANPGWLQGGKCGQTGTRADDRDQRYLLAAMIPWKNHRRLQWAREEKKKKSLRSINGPLYYLVLLKLRGRISLGHFNCTCWTTSASKSWSQILLQSAVRNLQLQKKKEKKRETCHCYRRGKSTFL